MTKRYFLRALFTLLIAGCISACNSSSDDTYDDDGAYTPETMYSSTAITSFNLKANNKVLDSLDKVFFTIDLQNARIFNADSLPYGTNISKLLMSITCSGSADIDVTIKGNATKPDTTFNYNTSSVDSIDFNRTVLLKVKSLNERYSRQYVVKVNVHKVKADSLYWNKLAWAEMPGKPSEQRTVEFGNEILTFSKSSTGDYLLWKQSVPCENSQPVKVDFGFTPDIRSIAASDNALYALSTEGALYTSADGSEWTATDEVWHHIYGGYTDKILGVKSIDGKYFHVTYPATKVTEVPLGCPVSGTSQLVAFDSKWSIAPQVTTVGGRLANGNLTSDAWSYDGEKWGCIGKNAMPYPVENATLFTYFSFRPNFKVSWKVTKLTTLFAMGGVKKDGTLNDSIYISRDYGVNWKKADDLLQLPSYIPARMNSDVVIDITKFHSRAAFTGLSWNETASRELPWWWNIEGTPGSRAVTPVTEWDCPYIYLYGGTNAEGVLYGQVWRGVINRLTFKPLE